jgi:cytosine/adenosine deaminase-related metal-dependent hydrolase
MNSYCLKARLIFPVVAPPVSSGIVEVRDGIVAQVGRGVGREGTDLGNVALLPGLVNAHTHLEFSRWRQPIAGTPSTFADWIRRVIEDRSQRRGLDHDESAVTSGLRESWRSGTACVGEIAVVPHRAGWLEAFAGGGVQFLELMGTDEEQLQHSLSTAAAYAGSPRLPGGWTPGLCPHAPYTAPPRLVQRTVELARRHDLPVAMHVSESREELRLLNAHEGPLVELLTERGAWRPNETPKGTRALHFLQLLSAAPRSLVVHGNYLDEEELAFLAGAAARMSVVYCPRTHDYFGHAPYPLAPMLHRGIRVAIGTDSRASNPDLSIYEELKYIARRHPAVRRDTVLRLGTIESAQALGAASSYGCIAPGRRAHLVAVSLPDNDAADPYELLFHEASSVVEVWG